MPELKRFIRLCVATAIGLVVSTGLFSAQAQERELKVGYMKNPIQDASLDMMETWAKAHGVKLTRVPMAYSVFMEKVTATRASWVTSRHERSERLEMLPGKRQTLP